MEEVLHLHRVDVLAAGDDDVLLAVDKVNEAVLVGAGHVAGEQPAVAQDFSRRLGVVVVALHHAGALHGQLTDGARRHRLARLVHDLGLPLIAGDPDGPHLVDVLHAEVHAARADGLGKPVVGVVGVVGEALQPAVDEARRHRLGPHVHEAPLGQFVVVRVDVPALDGLEDVLHPGHQQPHDGDLLVGDRLEDPFRLGAPQEHALAAGQQAAEPVHLAAGVVERRDAEERVAAGLAVMVLLALGG